MIAVIALGTAGVALAMRDTGQTLLEREAVRLAALLDAARSQSRASGVRVTWQARLDESGASVMDWRGLRSKEPLPTHWLDTQTRVVAGGVPTREATGGATGVALSATALVLGPDPVIMPARVRLKWGTDTRDVVTDGVGAFTVEQP